MARTQQNAETDTHKACRGDKPRTYRQLRNNTPRTRESQVYIQTSDRPLILEIPMKYIDTYEKALIFWLSMTGGAFACIIVGMELGELIGNFFQLSS